MPPEPTAWEKALATAQAALRAFAQLVAVRPPTPAGTVTRQPPVCFLSLFARALRR